MRDQEAQPRTSSSEASGVSRARSSGSAIAASDGDGYTSASTGIPASRSPWRAKRSRLARWLRAVGVLRASLSARMVISRSADN